MARERVFRRTDAGHQALASGNVGMAGGEYRRILELVANDMHFDGVRAAMPQYADAVISRWLRELEARGLLESVEGTAGQDLDFTSSLNVAQLHPRRGTG